MQQGYTNTQQSSVCRMKTDLASCHTHLSTTKVPRMSAAAGSRLHALTSPHPRPHSPSLKTRLL